jgi:hypothetical protein
MDILKYITNKDVELSNDDFNIEKLTKDIRKGYVEEKEAKAEYEAEFKAKEDDYKNQIADLTKKYADLENSFNGITEKYNTTTEALKSSNLTNTILKNGFNEADVEKVSKLRTGVFNEIEDDNEAVQNIKEQYGKVFFEDPTTKAPDEAGFNAKTNVSKDSEIVITRNTSIKNLIKKGE